MNATRILSGTPAVSQSIKFKLCATGFASARVDPHAPESTGEASGTRKFRLENVLVFSLCILAVSWAAPFAFAKEPASGEDKSAASPEKLIRFTGSRVRMGVPFNITVYAREESIANAAMDKAFARIKELNAIFSDYNPHSENLRITKNAVPGQPVSISEDMRILLSRSQEISKQSHGAVDVTISPLVKLWRLADRSGQLPTDEAIAAARARVGWENLEIDTEASTLTFEKPGMALDFGAIAKGYACDEALEVLKAQGLSRALVEAGGDLACGDPPPGKPGWIIAIEALEDRKSKTKKTPRKYLIVKNQGVATSGDLYQFVEIDGLRYSHIVDPRTGLGLTTRGSATVIAPNGTRADALASAVSVLGPNRGKWLAESMDGVEMLMVYLNGNGRVTTVTSEGFGEYIMEIDKVSPSGDGESQ